MIFLDSQLDDIVLLLTLHCYVESSLLRSLVHRAPYISEWEDASSLSPISMSHKLG